MILLKKVCKGNDQRDKFKGRPINIIYKKEGKVIKMEIGLKKVKNKKNEKKMEERQFKNREDKRKCR